MDKGKTDMELELVKRGILEGYYDHIDATFRRFLENENNTEKMTKCVQVLQEAKEQGNVVYVIGNGGSAAIAEHAAIDFAKNAGLRALAVSGSPMLTTYSNDYGYENVFKKYIEMFGDKGDVLVAISSSGQSENILKACREACDRGMMVITLSGFKSDNPLKQMGDINLWIDTKAFGFLEILHGLILHWINDSIIGSEVYLIR